MTKFKMVKDEINGGTWLKRVHDPEIQIGIKPVSLEILEDADFMMKSRKMEKMYRAAPALFSALEIIERCHADENGGTTLGSYEMSKVHEALSMARITVS